MDRPAVFLFPHPAAKSATAGLLPVAALLLATFLWGLTFSLVKSALADANAFSFLALRFVLALAATALFAPRGVWRPDLGGWAKGIATGAALYGAFLFQTLGLRFTSAANSAFITGLCVLLVPLLLWAGGRRPGRFQAAGALVATVGLFWLSGVRFSETGRGDLLTLGSALLFAVHIICLGTFGRGIPPSRFFPVQLATAAALAVPAALLWGGPVRPSAAVVLALLVTGLLATALGFFLQTWAQHRMAPARAALWLLFEPVFALLFGVALLREIPPPLALLGAVLILAGIGVSEGGKGARARPAASRRRPAGGTEEAGHVEA